MDGANTGLVTNTTPLPNLQGVYNVGVDGLLSPVPGDDNGFYVARARVIDQSGNQSNADDPNAQLPFIVDTTAPTASFVSPTSGQVITSLTGSAIPVHDHDQREHRPDPFHGRVDRRGQRRPPTESSGRRTTSPSP